MVTELPPPPAPLVERLEASFPLPAELAPYEYLWASDGETPPENPVRLASAGSPIANPIELLLDRLGGLFLKIWDKSMIQMPVVEASDGGDSGGLGDAPVPTGDPIPVGGGGGGPNGG
ncbi:MAG: hypothetical protein ACLGI9_21690 [Thermoanaerobaculia bacterium]